MEAETGSSASSNVSPSPLSVLIDETLPSSISTEARPFYELATQVFHNLRYEHRWSDLCFHHTSPVTGRLLPRPLLSGLPPKRMYIHPDEQIEILQQGASEDDLSTEPEWVLPTHIREKWSLKRFAEVFDAITEAPPSTAPTAHVQPRRGGKRLVLATVHEDSTIVFYIIHDGIVKPRQN